MDPIRNESACSSAPCHVHPSSQRILGVLELEMSLDRMEAGMAANRTRLLGVSGGLVLAVCVAVFVLIHRLIARRIALLGGDGRSIPMPKEVGGRAMTRPRARHRRAP